MRLSWRRDKINVFGRGASPVRKRAISYHPATSIAIKLNVGSLILLSSGGRLALRDLGEPDSSPAALRCKIHVQLCAVKARREPRGSLS